MSERKVPPMPVWTTLEQLQAERDRIAKAAGKPAMKPHEYREHLAEVLPIRDIPEAWEQ